MIRAQVYCDNCKVAYPQRFKLENSSSGMRLQAHLADWAVRFLDGPQDLCPECKRIKAANGLTVPKGGEG